MHLVISAAWFILLVLVLIDVIGADEWRIRNLNKVMWVFIIIILPLVGSVLWFAVGRSYDRPVDLGSFGDPRRREALAPREESIEEQLAAIDREIAYHEKQAEIRRLEADLKARREAQPEG